MGKMKELFLEQRGSEKPSYEFVLKRLIHGDDSLIPDRIELLKRIEPPHIGRVDTLKLILQCPLAYLKHVYDIYGIHGIGKTMPRSFSDEIRNKILELENELPELTLRDVYVDKLKIASDKNLSMFYFEFKGRSYFCDMISEGLPIEITKI